MDTVTLLFVFRTTPGSGEPAVGEGLHLWRDDVDPTVVRGAAEISAGDLDEALARGRALADEIAPGRSLTVEEVSAMDDERQLVWRANP